jgi:hypothetical protein
MKDEPISVRFAKRSKSAFRGRRQAPDDAPSSCVSLDPKRSPPDSGSRPVNMKVLGYALFIGATDVSATYQASLLRPSSQRLGIIASASTCLEAGLVHANGDGAVFVRALAGWRVDFERMDARRIGCGKRDLGDC